MCVCVCVCPCVRPIASAIYSWERGWVYVDQSCSALNTMYFSKRCPESVYIYLTGGVMDCRICLLSKVPYGIVNSRLSLMVDLNNRALIPTCVNQWFSCPLSCPRLMMHFLPPSPQSPQDQTRHSQVRPHLPRLSGRPDGTQEQGQDQSDAGRQGLPLCPGGRPRGGRPA